jgi:hypothetical protein
VNQLYAAVEVKVSIILKAVAKYTVQMDELWLFVDNKGMFDRLKTKVTFVKRNQAELRDGFISSF